jgi:hypothetical protein
MHRSPTRTRIAKAAKFCEHAPLKQVLQILNLLQRNWVDCMKVMIELVTGVKSLAAKLALNCQLKTKITFLVQQFRVPVPDERLYLLSDTQKHIRR